MLGLVLAQALALPLSGKAQNQGALIGAGVPAPEASIATQPASHDVTSSTVVHRAIEALEAELVAEWQMDRHQRTAKYVRAMASGDLPNYYKHASRVAVGPSFMLQFDTKAAAIEHCEAMGYTCAGFSEDVTTGKCEVVPRGYALSRDEGYDFFRKKIQPEVQRRQ